MLKKWIYEHIEHPYPTEAEKFQLMKVGVCVCLRV